MKAINKAFIYHIVLMDMRLMCCSNNIENIVFLAF